MALARPLSMFQNNPDSLDCTRRCDQAVIRRESNSPDHAAMMLNQSLLFRFPPSPCRRSLPRCSRGFRTSCGRRRLRKKTISTRSKQSFACAVLSLQGNAPRISNVAHTPPIPSLNLQRRVRVTAERMVTRTRSESSSSALKVPKSSLLHYYCGGRLHLSKPPPCSRPDQDKRGGFRIPLHSRAAARLCHRDFRPVALAARGCIPGEILDFDQSFKVALYNPLQRHTHVSCQFIKPLTI